MQCSISTLRMHSTVSLSFPQDIAEMEIANPLWGMNITGFRLVDKEQDPYVSFIEGWRSAITNETYAEVEDLYKVCMIFS